MHSIMQFHCIWLQLIRILRSLTCRNAFQKPIHRINSIQWMGGWSSIPLWNSFIWLQWIHILRLPTCFVNSSVDLNPYSMNRELKKHSDMKSLYIATMDSYSQVANLLRLFKIPQVAFDLRLILVDVSDGSKNMCTFMKG